MRLRLKRDLRRAASDVGAVDPLLQVVEVLSIDRGAKSIPYEEGEGTILCGHVDVGVIGPEIETPIA